MSVLVCFAPNTHLIFYYVLFWKIRQYTQFDLFHALVKRSSGKLSFYLKLQPVLLSVI
jgi:hypothetical protein